MTPPAAWTEILSAFKGARAPFDPTAMRGEQMRMVVTGALNLALAGAEFRLEDEDSTVWITATNFNYTTPTVVRSTWQTIPSISSEKELVPKFFGDNAKIFSIYAIRLQVRG